MRTFTETVHTVTEKYLQREQSNAKLTSNFNKTSLFLTNRC